MKTATVSNYFSLVEVTLAIGILATGMGLIIALIPIGIRQTRDSIGQNYSAIFAEDIYSYLSSLPKEEWSSLSSLPSYTELFTNGQPSTIISSINQLHKIEGTDLFSTNKNGVFAISKSTLSRREEDFSAQIVIWQSRSEIEGGITVNIEISWPLQQTEYSKRTKLRHYFEIYEK